MFFFIKSCLYPIFNKYAFRNNLTNQRKKNKTFSFFDGNLGVQQLKNKTETKQSLLILYDVIYFFFFTNGKLPWFVRFLFQVN